MEPCEIFKNYLRMEKENVQRQQQQKKQRQQQYQIQQQSQISRSNYNTKENQLQNITIVKMRKRSLEKQYPPQIALMGEPVKTIKSQHQQLRIEKLMENMSISGKQESNYILSKVNFEIFMNQQNKQPNQLQKVRQSYSKVKEIRKQNRNRKDKRIYRKIKMHTIDSQNILKPEQEQILPHKVVKFGSQQFEYEQFLTQKCQEHQWVYYEVNQTMQDTVNLPKMNLGSALDQDCRIDYQPKEESQHEDDQDSNDAENPDFDYPQEDDRSQSDEQIISGDDSQDERWDRRERRGSDCYEEGDDDNELQIKFMKRYKKMAKDRQFQEQVQYEEYD